MFCNFCGNQLPDGSKFCGRCGKSTTLQTEYTQNTGHSATYKAEPVNNSAENDRIKYRKNEDANEILKYAILGLALSSVFPILGLIFTNKSRSLVSAFIARYGTTQGCATVGKHLNIGGLIANIYYMITWAALILFYVVYFVFIIGIMGLSYGSFY